MKRKHQYAQNFAEEYTVPEKDILIVKKENAITMNLYSKSKNFGTLFQALFGRALMYGKFSKISYVDTANPNRSGTYWKWDSFYDIKSRFFKSMGEIHKFLTEEYPNHDIIYDLNIKSSAHYDRRTENRNDDASHRAKLLGYNKTE